MEKLTRVTIAWCVLLLLVLVLYLCSPLIPWSDLRKDVNLAAWIQAIGSIVAILASSGLFLLQHYLDERRQQAAELRQQWQRLNAAYQVAKGAASVCAECEESCLSGVEFTSNSFLGAIDKIAVVSAALDKIDVTWFGDFEIIESLLVLSMTTANLRTRVEGARIACASGRDWRAELLPVAIATRTAAVERRDRLKTAVNALGGASSMSSNRTRVASSQLLMDS